VVLPKFKVFPGIQQASVRPVVPKFSVLSILLSWLEISITRLVDVIFQKKLSVGANLMVVDDERVWSIFRFSAEKRRPEKKTRSMNLLNILDKGSELPSKAAGN
jgi:hypothetical protein